MAGKSDTAARAFSAIRAFRTGFREDFRFCRGVVLILGVLQVIAAVAILAGSQAARWFAVVVIGLNAIGQMLFIPAYPFWSLLIIAVDVVALWGLCAYGSRENLEAEA